MAETIKDAITFATVKKIKGNARFSKQVAEIIVSSVQLNFQKGGRYNSSKQFQGGNQRWVEVSKSYAKRKRAEKKDPKRILLKSGQLRSSITYSINGGQIQIGSNKVYAARHQFGKAGVPARPFIVIQDEDMEDIIDVAIQILR